MYDTADNTDSDFDTESYKYVNKQTQKPDSIRFILFVLISLYNIISYYITL